MSPDPIRLSHAFLAACEDELRAPKPGNVHEFAAGHGMEVKDFVDSAHAAAVPLTTPGISVGARIFAAVEATFARVGQNTNLGIVLLCAPIAEAALKFPAEESRSGVARVLAGLTREDAELAFKAIARANPGGLGSAPRDDVREPARVTLLEAMRESADRDRIAYQYAHDFEDVFDLGLTTLRGARAKRLTTSAATLRLYLGFLGAFPDSHVERKFGAEAAALLLSEARAFTASLDGLKSQADVHAAALRWDRSLKERGLNPGTSADLTVATLFAEYCVGALANACKNG